MSVPPSTPATPSPSRRHRIARGAAGLTVAATVAAGAFALLGGGVAFAGSQGQQVHIVNPSNDPVEFTLSGYNQYGQYTTQVVDEPAGTDLFDSGWWWEYALNVQEVDQLTGAVSSYQVDVPVIQSDSDYTTFTGTGPATSQVLSSSPDPAVAGETVTFTDKVAPSALSAQQAPGQAATGTVTFYDESFSTGLTSRLGSAPLVNGVATFTDAKLAAGTHYVFASYSGDNLDWASTTTVDAETIDPAVYTLQVSPSPVSFGDQGLGVKATKLVTLTDTGNVAWSWSGAFTGTATVGLTSGGTCSFSNVVQPGQSCTFNVFFAPSVPGPSIAPISFTSNFPTVTLDVTGTGIAKPTVTKITPTSGPTAGGTKVTITGTNFVGVTGISVGNAAKSWSCASSTTCTVITPAGTGLHNVTVTNAAGTSAKVTADQFTY